MGRRTSEADEDGLGLREGDSGNGSASTGFGGCVGEFVPGVGGEIVGVQCGKAARRGTPGMNVQFTLRIISGRQDARRDTHTSQDRGMVASRCRCGVRVVVDGWETFPGDGVGLGVEGVEVGFPDASLEAIERGHVSPSATAPDIETVGSGFMGGSCTDTGLGDVGEGRRGAERAPQRVMGLEVEDVDRAVDGDAGTELARVEDEPARAGDGGAVGRAGTRTGSAERPADRHAREPVRLGWAVPRTITSCLVLLLCLKTINTDFPLCPVWKHVRTVAHSAAL